jgi:hypothetical protein
LLTKGQQKRDWKIGVLQTFSDEKIIKNSFTQTAALVYLILKNKKC